MHDSQVHAFAPPAAQDAAEAEQEQDHGVRARVWGAALPLCIHVAGVDVPPIYVRDWSTLAMLTL